MIAFKLVCFAVLFTGTTLANVANHVPCEELPQDTCTVSQVRMDPCSNPSSCRLKKGSPASISFDFTPNFSANNLKAGLFWASPSGDVPFSDLYNADACGMTSCPTETSKEQQLSYGLKLDKKLPSGTFIFKFKVWNADDENQVCCFKTQVQLRR